MSYYKKSGSKLGYLLLAALIVGSYFFPNLPRQLFRIAMGGIENIIVGGRDILQEELPDFAQGNQIIYPDVVTTKYGKCSSSLMERFPQNTIYSVISTKGLDVMSSTDIFATRKTHLPQSAQLKVIGEGKCIQGIAWWPIEAYDSENKLITGYAIGGKMEGDIDDPYSFYFLKQ